MCCLLLLLLLLLPSRFNRVWPCATPEMANPTRLCHPWDSPGKNTGVGCHFLLQCRKVKVKSLSRVWLFETTWTAAYQAPLSTGFSRQECWRGCHRLLRLLVCPFITPPFTYVDPNLESQSVFDWHMCFMILKWNRKKKRICWLDICQVRLSVTKSWKESLDIMDLTDPLSPWVSDS